MQRSPGDVVGRLGDLARLGRVRTRVVATDDVWMRDIGPTFVLDERAGTVAIDWVFNAWGGKYPPWERDDAVARHVAALAGVPRVRSELVAEGGALEVDGRGTLIATRATLIDERRNPGAGLAEVERVLRDLLGVARFLWLDGCIEGDDTDGHVDEIVRFAAPGRVVCARESNERDPNHEPLERCRARLLAEPDLEVIDLPMPPPIEAEGERLPASYANFYVANAAVLVPAFGADSDVQGARHSRRSVPGPESSADPVEGAAARTGLRPLPDAAAARLMARGRDYADDPVRGARDLVRADPARALPGGPDSRSGVALRVGVARARPGLSDPRELVVPRSGLDSLRDPLRGVLRVRHGALASLDRIDRRRSRDPGREHAGDPGSRSSAWSRCGSAPRAPSGSPCPSPSRA